MFLVAAVVVLIMLAITFVIRSKDLPPLESEAPEKHLEARKSQIYENLRDLQFEFRVGKLSDSDYQRTKTELQGELAQVLAEIETVKSGKSPVAPAPPVKPLRKCPHCGAEFEKPLKFCGECGKAMMGGAA